jgi:hypothetical protein
MVMRMAASSFCVRATDFINVLYEKCHMRAASFLHL